MIDEDMPDRDLYQLLRAGALPHRMSMLMVLPTAAMIAVSLTLTFVAGPLFDLTDRAADDLMERTPYLSAVLGADVPDGEAP